MNADISAEEGKESQSSAQKEGLIYTSYTFSALTVVSISLPLARKGHPGLFTAMATGPPPPSPWASSCYFWSQVLPVSPSAWTWVASLSPGAILHNLWEPHNFWELLYPVKHGRKTESWFKSILVREWGEFTDSVITQPYLLGKSGWKSQIETEKPVKGCF